MFNKSYTHCRHVKFQGTMKNGPYKYKHTEQHKNTQNTKTQQTVRINYFYLFLMISEMISQGNVELPPWYGQ